MFGLNKTVTLGSEAREELIKGVDILANAVKATLGPKGRNVIIQRDPLPKVTKDGVTVAKAIKLEDPIQNLGCTVAQMAALKTNDQAGDGTTTSTVLAQAIVKEGHKLITAGSDPVQLKREMDNALEYITTYIKDSAIKVEGDWNKVKNIATISANNDEFIGKIITDAFEEVGADGVITIDNSKTGQTYMEVVKGMQFDRGYLSPYFVTNPDTMKAEFEDCYILIYDGKIRNMKGIPELIGKVAQKRKPLLIIAEEIDVQTLHILVVNKMQMNLPVVAVKAPAYGNRRQKILEDIAILTGGSVVTENQGLTLDNVDLNHLGAANKIVVTAKDTTIIEGHGKSEEVEARIKTLRNQIDLEETEWGKERVKERIGKLSNGVATLRVGAATDIELGEIKDRVEDALRATRAALEEGIVPGGGTALINAIIEADIETSGVCRTPGGRILTRACQAPLKTIVENTGRSGAAVVAKLLEGDTVKIDNWGYNAHTERYEDLLEAGVIDPAKVVRVALENAVSVASMILTTECSITDVPEEPKYDPSMIQAY